MSRRLLPKFIPIPRRGVNYERPVSSTVLCPMGLRPCLPLPRITNLSMSLGWETPAVPRPLPAPSAPAPPISRVPPALASYGNGVETLSCRWGKKWYGNVLNVRRNLSMGNSPGGPSTRRQKRFRVKKYHLQKRYQFKRMKVAAIGNTPFTKKVRVMMAGRFDHHSDKDIDAISSQQLDDATSGRVDPATTGKKTSRGRAKSKYT